MARADPADVSLPAVVRGARSGARGRALPQRRSAGARVAGRAPGAHRRGGDESQDHQRRGSGTGRGGAGGAARPGARGQLMRIGSGIDVHAFGPGDFIMLGGVRIPHTHGVVAHSDGDVVLHALCDALLGAAGLGDIGHHFSDSEPQWKGADSARFVASVLALLRARRLAVANVDLTVLAQAPKIAPYREAMRRQIAQLLEVGVERVNIKATTTEGLGFLGRAEGIAAPAVGRLSGTQPPLPPAPRAAAVRRARVSLLREFVLTFDVTAHAVAC